MKIPNGIIVTGIVIVPIRPDIPMMAKELNILDPKSVPTAISIFPFLMMKILAIISGSDVPRARALAETTSVPILVNCEIFTIDLTVNSAASHSTKQLIIRISIVLM